MSYLRYVCLFAYSGVQHILCCVFDLFFYVFRTIYCQFLCIVLFDCPLLFSNVNFCYLFYLRHQTSNRKQTQQSIIGY